MKDEKGKEDTSSKQNEDVELSLDALEQVSGGRLNAGREDNKKDKNKNN